ncbi:hypothetical protein BST22_01750 [Mycolicibacterium chubuense]|nr:hypothetical protein BST22_01750 [Mycolicibacterium chubuense]
MAGERVGAQKQEAGRLRLLHGRDDGGGCLGGVSGLRAVDGVVLLATLPGRLRVVVDGAR